MTSIFNACLGVLCTADPAGKCTAAAEAALSALEANSQDCVHWDLAALPLRPARPEKPILVSPGEVPRRRLGTRTGRIALLHALAHIELNAIDLAFDMVGRFAPGIAELGLDVDTFAKDWIRIGVEESHHFRSLETRLIAYGASYGDLPAHDSLWGASERTSEDVLARLAIAPLVLEARGLDVTETMADRLAEAGDLESAAAVRTIFEDEIQHVAAGVRWFKAICARRKVPPEQTFRALVQHHFEGGLKAPFNNNARARAGMPFDFYANAN